MSGPSIVAKRNVPLVARLETCRAIMVLSIDEATSPMPSDVEA